MTTLYLHVGPPKTATTSLQAFLASAEDQLLVDGVLYPRKGRLQAGVSYRVLNQRNEPMLLTGPDIAQHLLPWTLLNLVEGLTPEPCWNRVLDEIRSTGPEAVILSSEVFSWLPDDGVRRVGQLLRDFAVEVVIYFRDELDWQLSRYKQNVKTGMYYRPFRSFIREDHLRFISYERLIRRYADVFGPKNVRLRSFEKMRRQTAFGADFIRMLGKDPAKYVKPGRRTRRKNTSPPDDAINMIRWLNSVQHHLGPPFSAGFFQRSRQGVLQNRGTYKILRRIGKPAFDRPTARREDARFLRDLTRPWLQEILDRYMAPDDRAFHVVNH